METSCTCRSRFVLPQWLKLEGPHSFGCPADDAVVVDNIRVPPCIMEKWRYLERHERDWIATYHTAQLHEEFDFMVDLGNTMKLRRACYALSRLLKERSTKLFEQAADVFYQHRLWTLNDVDNVFSVDHYYYQWLEHGTRCQQAARSLLWRTDKNSTPLDDATLWPKTDGHYLMPTLLASHVGGVDALGVRGIVSNAELFEAARFVLARPWKLHFEHNWGNSTADDRPVIRALPSPVFTDLTHPAPGDWSDDYSMADIARFSSDD